MASTNSPVGRFIWRDLMVPDVEAAKAFYGQLLGWSYQAMPLPETQHGGTYWIVQAGGRGIGGMMALPPGNPAPPSWTSYVFVPDVAATCGVFTQRGGRVLVPATPIPGGGRFAVLQDPQGAVLGLVSGEGGQPPPDGPPPAGTFCWETLSARDPGQAKAFYAAVLGWKELPGPGPDVPLLATADGAMLADLQAARHGPPSWATYVLVTDLAAARDRAGALGGRVVVPEVEVPKIGRFAFIADPQGAMLGLFQPGR